MHIQDFISMCRAGRDYMSLLIPVSVTGARLFSSEAITSWQRHGIKFLDAYGTSSIMFHVDGCTGAVTMETKIELVQTEA